MDAGGRLGGAKRRHISNLGKTYQESHRRQRGGGYRERESRSGIQSKAVMYRGNPECWDGDGRHPGGRMNLCVRRRCWDGDGRRPGGKMTSFGS